MWVLPEMAYGNLEVVHLLPAAAAAREGKVAEVERMLAEGLTSVVNEITEFGGTAFTQACAAGQLATARLLLGAGADVNVKTAVRGENPVPAMPPCPPLVLLSASAGRVHGADDLR